MTGSRRDISKSQFRPQHFADRVESWRAVDHLTNVRIARSRPIIGSVMSPETSSDANVCRGLSHSPLPAHKLPKVVLHGVFPVTLAIFPVGPKKASLFT